MCTICRSVFNYDQTSLKVTAQYSCVCLKMWPLLATTVRGPGKLQKPAALVRVNTCTDAWDSGFKQKLGREAGLSLRFGASHIKTSGY